MPPTDTKTYSPGAERAIIKICGSIYALSQVAIPAKLQHDFVECVSRETHDAEMLEALRTILSSTDHITEPLSNLLQIRATAGALIAKVEGR